MLNAYRTAGKLGTALGVSDPLVLADLADTFDAAARRAIEQHIERSAGS